MDLRHLPDPAQFDAPTSTVANAPFPFLVAHDLVAQGDAAALERDFPRYAEAGFFPYAEGECGPALRQLVAALTAPTFASALGGKLGLRQLDAHPCLVTLCRSLNKRHGTIHTDSRSKIATALLYLNPDWPETSDGCLRFLTRGDDINALATPEIRPIYGTFTAFARRDNSFHGHLPFEGERRVIQVAWLTDAEAVARKARRGRFTRWMKGLIGGLDRRLGAGRSVNARHD
jgi:hypothetical protein